MFYGWVKFLGFWGNIILLDLILLDDLKRFREKEILIAELTVGILILGFSLGEYL
jgi:hypothetical protein